MLTDLQLFSWSNDSISMTDPPGNKSHKSVQMLKESSKWYGKWTSTPTFLLQNFEWWRFWSNWVTVSKNFWWNTSRSLIMQYIGSLELSKQSPKINRENLWTSVKMLTDLQLFCRSNDSISMTDPPGNKSHKLEQIFKESPKCHAKWTSVPTFVPT